MVTISGRIEGVHINGASLSQVVMKAEQLGMPGRVFNVTLADAIAIAPLAQKLVRVTFEELPEQPGQEAGGA